MAASIMALTFFESRLFPRSERSLRRKTEIRSERSYASIHRYMVAGCLPNALATFCTFSKVRLARSISSKGLRTWNRVTALFQASAGMETRSGVHAFWLPGVRSGLASRTGMRSSRPIAPRGVVNSPVTDAYFGYASRGCVRKCSFCGVPKLEGDQRDTDSLSTIVAAINEHYGPKKDLILMDNNIVASPRFKEIVAEIRDIGFIPGAKLQRRVPVQRRVDFNQ